MQETQNKIDIQSLPIMSVEPGKKFTLKVQNAFGKSFKTVQAFESFLADDIEKQRHNHPCTGPIEVKTNRKNISLAITLLDLRATRGYQCISQSTGVLKDRFTERQCTIYDGQEGNIFRFKGDDLLMRGSPKLGFISTIDNTIRSCGRTSENGGNIDLNFLDKGSTIYLPVNADTARFLVGDLHICQGNGEAAGLGIEADGEVTLKVDIVDKINFPIINHKDYLVIVGWGNTTDDCLRCSVENTISFLQRVFPFCDWNEGEIYKFISAEGNLTMGNSSGNIKTCGTVFYKKRLKNKWLFPIFT